jgi:hypothetical protein
LVRAGIAPANGRGVKLIVVMRRIGGGYPGGAANAPISWGRPCDIRLMQIKSAVFPAPSMAFA